MDDEQIVLSKRILCAQCRGATNERFDCRMETDTCNCEWSDRKKCKCCPICRFVVTAKIESRQFDNFDYQRRDRVMDTGCYESDVCDQCKEPVYHEYHYMRSGLTRNNGLYRGQYDEDDYELVQELKCSRYERRGYTSSSGSGTESVSSGERRSRDEYDYQPTIRVFNASIQQLHNLAVKRFQQRMRGPVQEWIATNREKIALKLGRTLTQEEVSKMWKDYLMFKMQVDEWMCG
jgi:hypothetical protein